MVLKTEMVFVYKISPGHREVDESFDDVHEADLEEDRGGSRRL